METLGLRGGSQRLLKTWKWGDLLSWGAEKRCYIRSQEVKRALKKDTQSVSGGSSEGKATQSASRGSAGVGTARSASG